MKDISSTAQRYVRGGLMIGSPTETERSLSQSVARKDLRIKELETRVEELKTELRHAKSDLSSYKTRAHSLNRKLTESGAEKAIETLHTIQDMLRVGRTYAKTLQAVRELVIAAGGDPDTKGPVDT